MTRRMKSRLMAKATAHCRRVLTVRRNIPKERTLGNARWRSQRESIDTIEAVAVSMSPKRSGAQAVGLLF